MNIRGKARQHLKINIIWFVGIAIVSYFHLSFKSNFCEMENKQFFCEKIVLLSSDEKMKIIIFPEKCEIIQMYRRQACFRANFHEVKKCSSNRNFGNGDIHTLVSMVYGVGTIIFRLAFISFLKGLYHLTFDFNRCLDALHSPLSTIINICWNV